MYGWDCRRHGARDRSPGEGPPRQTTTSTSSPEACLRLYRKREFVEKALSLVRLSY